MHDFFIQLQHFGGNDQNIVKKFVKSDLKS